MKLHDLVEAYIDYKRSLGMRLRSQAAVLRAYCRHMDNIGIEEVKAESVLAFVAATGPVTTRWIENHRVLGGFYRYAVGRGFATISPLPHGHSETPDMIYTSKKIRITSQITSSLRALSSLQTSSYSMEIWKVTLHPRTAF